MNEMQGFDFSNGVPVPVDLDDSYNQGQDVDDPVWASVLPDPSGAEDPRDDRNMMALTEQTEIRTNSGGLDLLHSIVELTDWTHQETSEAAGHRQIRSKPPQRVMDVRTVVANKWRGTTWSVGGTGTDNHTKVCENRPNRTRALIKNTSAGIIYISHDSGPGGITQNTYPIAAGASETLFHTNEIWVFAAVPATAQTFSVIEEYYEPEYE